MPGAFERAFAAEMDAAERDWQQHGKAEFARQAFTDERNTVAQGLTQRQTSITKALDARPSITMAQRGIYHLLKHIGPSTDADLVFLYPGSRRILTRGDRYPEQQPSGIRTRRSELVRKGYVVKHDTIRQGGRKVTLWRAI